MPSTVGGVNAYSSLQGILDLYRSLTNTNIAVPGTPDVASNDAPFTLPFLGSSIKDLFSDLRLAGSETLIRDNYILTGVPGIANGIANPATQCFLSYTGYFDGIGILPQYTLPIDLIGVESVSARQTGSNGNFYPLPRVGALRSYSQSAGLGAWEMRGDKLYFNGGLSANDIKLRYQATFPDLIGPNIDFQNTFVPILGCENAIAYKMTAKYAYRMSPPQFPMAKAEALEHTEKLKAEIVLRSQSKAAQRIDLF